MEEAKRSYKRRSVYFIEKQFQVGFILKFCALVAIGGMFTIAILYFLATQSTTVSFVNSRVVVRTTADFILPILIQTVAIVTVLVGLATVVVTLLVSHKIAGPLYRFKKVLEMLGQGDFSSGFKIRRLDQLQDVAAAFDNMIAIVRVELKALKGNFGALKEKLDNIAEYEVAEHRRSILNELKKISAELNKMMHYFKI